MPDEDDEIQVLDKEDLPIKGEQVYVGNSFYIEEDKRENDFAGGLCTVSEVEVRVLEIGEYQMETPFVVFEERPGWIYNYFDLLSRQDDLSKDFEDQVGHLDPDVR